MSEEKSFGELLTGCLGTWVIVLLTPILLALPSSVYLFYTWRWFAVPYLGLAPLPSIWAAIALNMLFAFSVRGGGANRPLREDLYKKSGLADLAYGESAKLLVFGTAAALHFLGLA